MVNLGILADLHIDKISNKKKIEDLIEELKVIFNEIDEILYVGDIGDLNFLKDLERIAPIIAIRGEADLGDESERFTVITRDNYPIGMIHVLPNNLEAFCEDNGLRGGILVYGHTHQPLIKGTQFNILLLNPGSPTFPKAPEKIRGFDVPKARPSVMKLKIENEIITAYIVNLRLKI
ncbi:MAG: YfcE family phosphodiesterase [Candidatus Lokiarchaeota archaeon]|nr:YfcE family phosphodiesterase [Candidatus Lokiarchaeota archaeon]MBD3201497.1 YfcE family phosphodiesterase [Candidatus Lokiarchaeota archaeon]